MPRDIAYSHDSFVILTINDIQRLQKHKASGLTMRVYLVLKQHCFDYNQGNRFCFPSLSRIKTLLGYEGKNYNSAIGKCLRWLEQNNFIKRQQARKEASANRERFELLEDICPNDVKDICPNDVHKKKTKNKNKSPSFNSPQTGEIKTIRKRLSKQERRQRRYELRCKQIEEENQRIKDQEDAQQQQQWNEWETSHRTAQDEIISKTGSKQIEDQMTLVMARYSYENHFEGLWTYEPPRISEIGLQMDVMVSYIRNRKPFRNEYFEIFCAGSSLNSLEQWIRRVHQ